MNKEKIVLGIIVVVLMTASFYSGVRYGGKKSVTPFGQGDRLMTNSAQRNGSRTAFGGAIMGDIIAKDQTSITIKTREGSSRIVFFATSTQISKSSTSTADDLDIGASVTVNGSSNTDGSLNAQMIQIRPISATMQR